MRTFFFSALFLFFNFNYFSQSKSDSLEFQKYFDKAYQLRNINPDSAFFWIDKTLEVALLSGKKEWLAKTLNLKGILHFKKNDYMKSLTELEKALSYTNNNELKGKIYINLGNTLSDIGYKYSAVDYYKKAVKIFSESNNQQFLIRALMNLASEEFFIGHKNNARNHLKLALYYAREFHMVEEEAMCLNNLSAFFINSGLVDSASRYVYQSFNAYEQVENYFGLADAYLTAIELHLEKKEWEYAKALIDLADSLVDRIQYLEGKKLLTSEKVHYYIHTNHLENAANYFNEYLKLEDSLNNKIQDSATIPSPNEKNNLKEQSSAQTYFSWIQLFFIICLVICIFVFVLRNYRNVKE